MLGHCQLCAESGACAGAAGGGVRVGRYDVTVHEIEGMPDGVDEALLAWVRGPKAQFTKGAAVDNGKVAINQMLHQVATIYRCVASLSSPRLPVGALQGFTKTNRGCGEHTRPVCWVAKPPYGWVDARVPSEVYFQPPYQVDPYGWPRMQKSSPPHSVRFLSAGGWD